MAAITIADLENAKTDVDHIAAVATSSAPPPRTRPGGVKPTLKAAIDTFLAYNIRGAWVTLTAYAVKDVVSSGGAWYLCVVAHTSGATFAGDLATKWRVFQGEIFTQAGSGAVARTVQDKLQDVVSVEDFFIAAEADAAPMFNRAAVSGAKHINAKGRTYALGSVPVAIGAGQVWDLAGSTFTTTTSTASIFTATTVDDWAIIGPFTIEGNGSSVGTAKGIAVTGCNRWRIVNPTVKTLKGWGIYVAPGTPSGSLLGDQGVIVNPQTSTCYKGLEFTAGTGAEYCTVIAPMANGCGTGVTVAAGNVSILGGNIVDNTDGLVLSSGSNHGHGIIANVNINHNTQYNVKATGVTNGQSLADCHLYGNGTSSGAIFLDGCKGIDFDGGILDCWVYNYDDGVDYLGQWVTATGYVEDDIVEYDGSRYVCRIAHTSGTFATDLAAGKFSLQTSGPNFIRNMVCPGSYGDIVRKDVNDLEPIDLVIENCRGPGAYKSGLSINDPSPCFVQATRDAAVTQALTSGVGATLTFPTEFDRRNAFAAGVFTVPAGQHGWYEVSGQLMFTGTAMNAAASYVDLQINSVSRQLFLPGIYSTTILTIPVSTAIYLDAGATLRLVGAITGTTPVFGGATWASSLVINRNA